MFPLVKKRNDRSENTRVTVENKVTRFMYTSRLYKWVFVSRLSEKRVLVWLLGGVTILWSVVCYFVVYDAPADHPRITKAELDYLTDVVQHSTVAKVASLTSFTNETYIVREEHGYELLSFVH